MRVLPILLMFTVIISLSACKEEQQETVEVPRPVKVVEIGMDDIGARKFPGEAQATDAVTLAFEVPGKLSEIKIDVGDKVKKGQVLASLDSRDFKNAVNAASAEVQRASAQYRRIKQAADLNAVSKQELTNALAASNSAQAELRIRKKALDDAVLRAPYDGVVAAKYVESFSNIQAKQKAIRIVNPDAIEMIVDVPENMISDANKGMTIFSAFDAFPEREFSAKITEIGAEADAATRTYPVTLAIDMPDDVQIKPGMTGRAWRKMTDAEKAEEVSAFVVPVTAIGDDGGKKFVWVIDPKTKTAKKRSVTTGDIKQNGVSVDGVQAGEFVAVAGVNSIKEGQELRLSKVEK